MYLRILKKDLKRKKTMNMIILLFVILSAMFFSSSVSNIISIIGGIDRFLDMAGMEDYVAFVGEPDSCAPLGELLDKSEEITSWKRESVISCIPESVKVNGIRPEHFGNIGVIVPVNDTVINCFDANNAPVTEVEQGKVYITHSLMKNAGIEVGDTVTFELCGEKLSLEVAGLCKDAVLGSDMVGIPRFIVNPADFGTLYDNDEVRAACRMGIYIVSADDVKAVEQVLKDAGNVRFSAARTLVKSTFLITISVAGIVMAVSVFLIIISFVVVRFTIGFTITEEFREIGVMKAIGMKNSSIRGLYLLKYAGIAIIGSVIGFFAGIPFGRMLLDSASGDMVLGNDHPVIIGLACSAVVVAMIVLFCYGCTAKIKKLSPIDAVRNGQTGERFKKHSMMSLGKSRLGTSGFISLNDIISSPKQSAVLTLVFTLCTVLVMVLSNTAETLGSDKLMYLISQTNSDIYINMNSELMNIQNGSKTIGDIYGEMESTLAENGMPGRVHAEEMYNVSAAYGDSTAQARFMYCSRTKTTDYYYNEGTAPMYDNEVALGTPLANELGVTIGDKVKLTVGGEQKEYIVSALYDSFSQLGMCGRFHESAELPSSGFNGTMHFQIDFDDAPDEKTIDSRIKTLMNIYDTKDVLDACGYVADCTKATEAVKGAKNLTMIVSMIIIVMMSVLLERSFISKEKSEIALMKAMGFGSRSVIGIHLLRFLLIGTVSIVTAAIISDPMTELIMNPMFGLMGILKGLTYAHNRVESFVIFPAAVLAAVMGGTFFTALGTGRIKASDTSNIE
ncbi:MAG: FtsX-like permease family protein [Ruminococcus sp.]|nr:FtsX-like permease family protein [Ruminococcus sp.]